MTQEEFDRKLDDVFNTLRTDAESYRKALKEKYTRAIEAAPDNYRLPKNAAIAIMFRLITRVGGFQYGEYDNDYAKANREMIRSLNPDIPVL